MAEEIKLVFEKNHYLLIMTIALVLGVIFCKGRRKVFFVPAVIFSAIILNPYFYSLWGKLSSYGYWRLVWALPVIPAFAIIPAYMIDRNNNRGGQIIILVIAAAAIIWGGSFVYNHQNTAFTRATNPEKLPQNVVNAGEALLEIDDEPRVVTDAAISQYIRQYSGKIKSMYARDAVFGDVNSFLAAETYANLSSSEGNMNIVAWNMQKNHYQYLVTRNDSDIRKSRIESAGFELVQQINGYGIYRIGD